MSRHGSRFGADTPIFVGGISGATGHNMSQPSGAFFLCCQGKRRQRRREGSGPKWVQSQLMGQEIQRFFGWPICFWSKAPEEGTLLLFQELKTLKTPHSECHIWRLASQIFRPYRPGTDIFLSIFAPYRLPRSGEVGGQFCKEVQNDELVGGLEHFLFSIIYGIILPIDVHIFQDA